MRVIRAPSTCSTRILQRVPAEPRIRSPHGRSVDDVAELHGFDDAEHAQGSRCGSRKLRGERHGPPRLVGGIERRAHDAGRLALTLCVSARGDRNRTRRIPQQRFADAPREDPAHGAAVGRADDEERRVYVARDVPQPARCGHPARRTPPDLDNRLGKPGQSVGDERIRFVRERGRVPLAVHAREHVREGHRQHDLRAGRSRDRRPERKRVVALVASVVADHDPGHSGSPRLSPIAGEGIGRETGAPSGLPLKHGP
jgi:hypothetical protein